MLLNIVTGQPEPESGYGHETVIHSTGVKKGRGRYIEAKGTECIDKVPHFALPRPMSSPLQ